MPTQNNTLPDGHTWHNPEGLPPELIGADYRLLLECEFERREMYELVELHHDADEARYYKRPKGWMSLRSMSDNRDINYLLRAVTYRVPATVPFLIPVEKAHLSNFFQKLSVEQIRRTCMPNAQPDILQKAMDGTGNQSGHASSDAIISNLEYMVRGLVDHVQGLILQLAERPCQE